MRFSEWAASIVPGLKSDKETIQICGDLKQTVNTTSKIYPLPEAERNICQPSCRKRFLQTWSQPGIPTGLSGSRFLQVAHHQHTKGAVSVHTRLPFGVTLAPGVLQRIMESVLQGISQVSVYLDNILITGQTEAEHLKRLDEVLARLVESGLHLNRNKSIFMDMSYLGHRIDAERQHRLPDKAVAVLEASLPQDVAQLKSYLGLLSYYSKFLPNLSMQLIASTLNLNPTWK